MPGDTLLDVSFNFGYLAAGMSTPYRPFVYAELKMVRASDKAVLMQRTIAYNTLNTVNIPETAVTIAPDPAYEFKDFDALIADPDRARRMRPSRRRRASGIRRRASTKPVNAARIKCSRCLVAKV